MEMIEEVEQKDSDLQVVEAAETSSAGNDLVSETKASKRNKGYDLADVRQFTEKNAEVDYKILLALYEHRALTPSQLKKGWFPTLHENSVRNRTKTLAERRILTVNVKPGIKTRPVKMYSLSAFGLRIVTENILQVMDYAPQYDKQKEHYTIDDLKVRSQQKHHYELQEWVMDVVSKQPDLFHCEWRRFPFLEDEESVIRVKPDWLFLEADEETKRNTNEDAANNPLYYPFLYRKKMFSDVTLTPALCVECDRGTMSRTELVDKWEGYRTLPSKYQPKAISIFYSPKNNGDMRHRLIRDTMSHAFELEAISDEVQFFQGDHELTQEVVNLYFERNKDLLKDEEMTNEKDLMSMFERYSQAIDSGEASVLDVEKTVQHLKLPVKPNHIIVKQNGSASLQLVFFAMPGWVNPFIKIQSLKRWLTEGHLSQFAKVDYILLYPDKRFLRDVRPMGDDIFYVSYQELKEDRGIWGKAHYEERKHRKVKWREVIL